MIHFETETTSTTSNSSTNASKEANSKFSSKSSGRWTKEEHQKFVEGLRKFGKNWKQVEEYVGTRNGAQIRSHAQKFFNRLEREYNVKVNGGKAQNSKKKGKENFRKESEGSISTYNSSQDNVSDDGKSVDLTKEELSKIESTTSIPKVSHCEVETNEIPKVAEIPSIIPESTKNEVISQEQVKEMIKNVLIICQSQASNLNGDKPFFPSLLSHSFFDMMSKINKVDQKEAKIQYPRLSDLVAMPVAQRQFVSFEKKSVITTPKFTCSFRISSSLSQDQNIDKKLKTLRKPVILQDDFLRKKVKTC
jgi:SHAQKYF class myb-like DNA-binding protein